MRYLIIIFLFIATFVSAQQQMFLRSTPAAGVTGILDSYTGAAAAYATALLYSGYSGSCLRVRRDSDDAEQDIGFSGQDIDEAAINSFCSGANCFVKTWHDQSGNGNDATQATQGNQPKIYDSSTGIIKINGITALYSDGTDDDFFISGTFNGSAASAFVATAPSVTSISQGGVLGFQSSPQTTHWAYLNGTFYERFFCTTRPQIGGSGVFSANVQVLISLVNTGSNLNSYKNSAALDTDVITFESVTDASLFRGKNSTIYYEGNTQIVVVYTSDQSANRTAIETIINNYFSIY